MAKKSLSTLVSFDAVKPISVDGQTVSTSSSSLISASKGEGSLIQNSLKAGLNRITADDVSYTIGKLKAPDDGWKPATVQQYLGAASSLLKNVPFVNTLLSVVLGNPVLAPPNMRETGLVSTIMGKASNGLNKLGLGNAASVATKFLGSPYDPKTYRDYTNGSRLEAVEEKRFEYKSSATKGNSEHLPLENYKDQAVVGSLVKKVIAKAASKLGLSLKGGTNAPDSPPELDALMFAVQNGLQKKLLNYSNEEIGLLASEFLDNDGNPSGRASYGNPWAKIDYKTITSPHVPTKTVNSPKEAIDIAVQEFGFTNGYDDWKGFAPGSNHIWGITMKPIGPPETTYSPITGAPPALPVIKVPYWTVDWKDPVQKTIGEYNINYGSIDYSTHLPVISYTLNWGTSREKDIDLFNNGRFSIPLGFSFQNLLTLDILDDVHGSLKLYFNKYFNSICDPSAGMMKPYKDCCFVVTLTMFKPGMKVKYMFKLICLPINYALTHEGQSEAGGGETIHLDMSIVGIADRKGGGAVDTAVGLSWDWNDVVLTPMGNLNNAK